MNEFKPWKLFRATCYRKDTTGKKNIPFQKYIYVTGEQEERMLSLAMQYVSDDYYLSSFTVFGETPSDIILVVK